jgi:hypothetical protein
MRRQMVRDPGIPGASVSAIWNQPMWPTCDWISPLHYVHWNAGSLNEMVDLLEETPAEVFALDIMYAKEHGFWTTWFFHKQPDTLYLVRVNITVRIFDASPNVQMPRWFDTLRRHQIDGDWPQRRLLRGFLGVLAATFHLGPGFRDQRSPKMPQTGVFAVNLLTVNFKESGLPGQDHPSLLVSDGFHGAKVLADGADRRSPESQLGGLLRTMLRRVLCLFRDDEMAPAGQMLYENVLQSIKFEVNGQSAVVVDIEAIFNNLDASQVKRVEGFDEWKARTAVRREMLKNMAPGQDQTP